MIYFILEKKRGFKNNQVEDPYWVERKVYFSLEEAAEASQADHDLYRIYSAPATLVAGTEDFYYGIEKIQ